MTMQEITAYKTTDDRIFEDREEADQHQTILNFEEWYNQNQLYGNSYVEFDEFVEWLQKNEETILKFLEDLNNAG